MILENLMGSIMAKYQLNKPQLFFKASEIRSDRQTLHDSTWSCYSERKGLGHSFPVFLVRLSHDV